MKNLERSRLFKEYRSQVDEFNIYNERVIKNKYEMSYLWKYKNDYPEDWRRKADMLTDDRRHMNQLKQTIKELKAKIRQSNVEHPQK
jgi:hypothetical protein